MRDEYANLKVKLLKEKSFENNNSISEAYTEGKHNFISRILKQIGFNRIRFMQCSHQVEWETAKLFRQKYFFDKVPTSDPYIWTMGHPDHTHFIVYKGLEIVGYAHIQFWPNARVAMRIIVIDEDRRKHGFGSQFLNFIEQWLKTQNFVSIHTESTPDALGFYQTHGYINMPFDDPEGYESHPQDIPVGKLL